MLEISFEMISVGTETVILATKYVYCIYLVTVKFHTVVLTSIIAVANEKHGGNKSLFPPLTVFAPRVRVKLGAPEDGEDYGSLLNLLLKPQ